MSEFKIRLKKVKGPRSGEVTYADIRAEDRSVACIDIEENQSFFKPTHVNGVKVIGRCFISDKTVFEDDNYITDPTTGQPCLLSEISKKEDDDE